MENIYIHKEECERERLTHREERRKGLDLEEGERVKELELWRNRLSTMFLIILLSFVYD
jgi:hypothetical protein